MKSVDLSPNSSVKSSTTATTSVESETRDSYYFPGCRKDANCNCEICIESINATLDLMPQSIHRSSLSKHSSSKPNLSKSPIAFSPTTFLTPESRTQSLNFNARLSFHDKVKRKKKELGIGVFMARFFMGLSLFFAAEYGFSWVVSGVLQPELSMDIVRNLGEKSLVSTDLNGTLSFLKEELRAMVESPWTINQDGLLLNSHNVLYKSMSEEVSIWGWPLQTAGLLTAEFSSRSFTVLSGRVTEWRNGEVGYLIRRTNSSWVQEKWSSSAVQLDPNTWILEYRQRFIMENARLISAALQLLKFRIVREVKKIQQEFWLLFAFGNQYSDFTEWRFKIPT